MAIYTSAKALSRWPINDESTLTLSSRAAGLLLPQDLHVQAYIRHEVPGTGSLPGSLLLGVTTIPRAYRLSRPLLLGPIIVLGAELLRPFLLLGVYGFLGPRN